MTIDSGTPSPLATRDLALADADDTRAIISTAYVAGSPYAARLAEWLDRALAGSSPEMRGLVVIADHRVVGVALHGQVAGTRGAAALYAVVVAPEWRGRRQVGRLLIAELERRLLLGGARVLIAELPDDAMGASLARLLHAAGFRDEARIADYFRHGVALTILRHDLLGRAD